ncbi:MAG: helix-turn-helix domain-containing protein [Candidatus Jettenia caeni]|nr:MAG: helix-turn-helix domain-containing protein [Candidatus Jettenia caeni]
MSKLLTVKEVAEYLGMSPEHIRHMCRLKEIPCAKLGVWRFDRADIEVWLEEKKQNPIKDMKVVRHVRIK